MSISGRRLMSTVFEPNTLFGEIEAGSFDDL